MVMQNPKLSSGYCKMNRKKLRDKYSEIVYQFTTLVDESEREKGESIVKQVCSHLTR